MIKEEIKVEYSVRKDNGAVTVTDYRDFAKDGENLMDIEAYDHTCTFHIFKNNGKVSKSDCSQYDLVNEEAEKLLAERLEIKSSAQKDMDRCKKLAEVVNNAWFNHNSETEWVTIKTKNSHSNWYQHGGELNSVSLYLTQVPAEVEKEAKELQSIRRKHQGDDTFDFAETSYFSREVRVADHENQD